MLEQIERTRVAWIDTDAGGRIHFTAASRSAEAAETALMLTHAWEIAKDGEIYVDGRHTVVHVNSDGRPAPLPEPVRTALGG